jgi:hypothetical protein
MIHYVYKITDVITNEYYFGSRSSKCNPTEDAYMGSMKVWKPNNNNLIKEILDDTFLTRNDALEYESNIIKNHINDVLNKNYHIPSIGFHTKGRFQSIIERETRSKYRIENNLSKGINNAMYGKKHSLNSIQLMQEKAKGRYSKEWFISKYGEIDGLKKYQKKATTQHNNCMGEGNGMFGKKHSNLTKSKMSEVKQKKVAKCNTENKILYIYSSITEAAKENNISISAISLVCDPKRVNKTAGGFVWKLI